jgi:hypothetical protein
MCLTYGQRRALRKLKRAIRVSDRRLAARLDMFGRLNRDQAYPESSSRSSRRRPERVQPTAISSIERLSETVPVYAAPDQDVCGVDMSLNSVHAVAA